MSKRNEKEPVKMELRKYMAAFIGGSVLYVVIVNGIAQYTGLPVSQLVCNSAIAFGGGIAAVSIPKIIRK